MTVEAVLSRLHRVRPAGNGWMALCPAHADSSPSLSICEQGERILLHCFAACTVEAICGRIGIKVRDLFTGPRTARKLEPHLVREARRQLSGLRSRLTPRDRERAVTIVLANETNLDAATARALALAVEGELVQVAFDREAQ